VTRSAVWRALIAAGAALACRSAPAPQTTPATAAAPVRRDVFVSIGDSFSPQSGDAAIQAFQPEIAAVDSGGECVVTRTSGSGAMTVTAYFPSRRGPQNQMSVTFDSAGRVVRFADRHGIPKPLVTTGMTPPQRDSALRASLNSVRSTSVSLDYAIDQAVAANRGGGKPTEAIIGSVRALEHLEKLGPPAARLERLRRLCGV
jgi:hypothetical protein